MKTKKQPARTVTAEPLNIEATIYGDLMDMYFRRGKVLGLTRAQSSLEFFGFHCNDVQGLHEHKQGFGVGLFFRLNDGRVFDVMARPHDPDPAYYDATTH
jgi:hypothetical protein